MTVQLRKSHDISVAGWGVVGYWTQVTETWKFHAVPHPDCSWLQGLDLEAETLDDLRAEIKRVWLDSTNWKT